MEVGIKLLLLLEDGIGHLPPLGTFHPIFCNTLTHGGDDLTEPKDL